MDKIELNVVIDSFALTARKPPRSNEDMDVRLLPKILMTPTFNMRQHISNKFVDIKFELDSSQGHF